VMAMPSSPLARAALTASPTEQKASRE